jgi:polysaccharide chain length determinant protein (PEP-CTERM system associated)
MIPGKRYTPEVLLRTIWRRKWLALVPFVLITSATFVMTRRLPNQYRAETLVLIVPQQVPEDYVQPTVRVRIEDRLASINQLILSRTRLEQIVSEFNLYAAERQTLLMADIIERMRTRDISVQTTGSGPKQSLSAPTFRISFTGRDPRTVMRVTERLASLFIEESLRDRTALAEGANQFLETQLQEARNRLIEQEKRLEAYRERHAGELPSELNSNMQAIQNIQLQIQALTQSLSQDRDRRQMVDRLLAEAEALAPVAAPPPVAAGKPESGAVTTLPAAQQLEAAHAELRGLELRLKPTHPDLARMRRVISRLEQKAEAESLQEPLSPTPSEIPQVPTSPQDLQRLARVRELAAERETLPRRIAAKETEEASLRDALSAYQARIAAVPARETELVELTRDYETLRQVYTSLLTKNENARASANLERRQIGEQFKMLEPARLPERPISPNRLQMNGMGTLGGLAVGLGLVLLLEYRDRSLRSESDVVGAFALPVLALVPAMVGVVETKRRRRRRVVSLAVAASVVAAGLVVAWRLGLVGRWL